MRTNLQPSTVQRLIWAASCATRCRLAAKDTDPITARSLERAAERYSGQVTELADQLAAEARQ